MNKNKNNKLILWQRHNLVVFVFILLIFIVLGQIGFFEFIPMGGDWAFPFTMHQASRLVDLSRFAWSDSFVAPWGVDQINLFPALWINFILNHLSLPLLSFILIIITFFSIRLLLNEIDDSFSPYAAFFSFLFYLFSAIVFDFLIMGWIYALVAISILPLAIWAFIRGVKGENQFLLISGVLFALSPVQSQAVIWFFLSFFMVSLVSLFKGVSFTRSIASLMVVCTIFFIGNAYWFPNLFLYPPAYINSSDIVNSSGSVGTSANFSLVNALRGWGALYNFQFETVQNSKGLSVFSFAMPLLAILGAAWHRSKYKWAFVLLMLSPFVLAFLGNNRQFLVLLPFANAFRDLPRFLILSLMGTSILAGMGVSVVQGLVYDKWGRFASLTSGLILLGVILIAIYPWWSGALTDWQNSNGRDIRLRFKTFPESYYNLEKKLQKEKLLQKIIYYPYGGNVSFTDDKRFSDAFQQCQDSFAVLSPIPGSIIPSDRHFGALDFLFDKLLHDTPDSSLMKILAESGVRLFAFRKNMSGQYKEPDSLLIRELVENGFWSVWFEDNEIVVYETNNFKPVVTSVELDQTDEEHILSSVVTGGVNSISALDQIKVVRNSVKNDGPIIEYIKKDPTLYRIRVHNAQGPFLLILNETFNSHWRLGVAPPLMSILPAIPKSVNFMKAGGAAQPSEIEKYMAEGWVTLPAMSSRDEDSSNLPLIDFVSLEMGGSIQNNNLPLPDFFDVIKMPSVANNNHIVVNGFANGWVIDPEAVCKENNCTPGIDDRIVLDFVIEFIPQRTFYIGGIVSIIGYCVLLVAGIYFIINNRVATKHKFK